MMFGLFFIALLDGVFLAVEYLNDLDRQPDRLLNSYILTRRDGARKPMRIFSPSLHTS